MANSLRWHTPDRPISFAFRRAVFLLLVLAVAVLVLVQSADDLRHAYGSFRAQRVIDDRSDGPPPRRVSVVLRREFQPSRNGVVFSGYKMTLAQARCASEASVIDLASTPTNWCSWSLVNPGKLWPHLRKCPARRTIGWIDPDVCREGLVSVRGSGRAISFGEFTGADSWLRLAFAAILKNLLLVAAYILIVGALSLFVLMLLHAMYGELLETDD
jgi:hypothetical protein